MEKVQKELKENIEEYNRIWVETCKDCMCLSGAVVTMSDYECAGPSSILGSPSCSSSQTGKVNCGNSNVTVALCSGVMDYCPPQAQKMWQEISAHSYAQLQRVLPFYLHTHNVNRSSNLNSWISVFSSSALKN